MQLDTSFWERAARSWVQSLTPLERDEIAGQVGAVVSETLTELAQRGTAAKVRSALDEILADDDDDGRDLTSAGNEDVNDKRR